MPCAGRESDHLKRQRDELLRCFTKIRAFDCGNVELERIMGECEAQYLQALDRRIEAAQACERQAAAAPGMEHLLTVALDTNRSVHAQMGDEPVAKQYLRSRRDPAVNEFVHAVVRLYPPAGQVRAVIAFVYDLYFVRHQVRMKNPVSAATAQDYAYKAIKANADGSYRYYPHAGKPYLDFDREVRPLVAARFGLP